MIIKNHLLASTLLVSTIILSSCNNPTVTKSPAGKATQASASATPTPYQPAPATVVATAGMVIPSPIPTTPEPLWSAFSMGPGGGGAFDVWAFTPGYVFVGSDVGAVFRSSDQGQTWDTANEGLYDYRINDIAVDPVHPSTIFLATSGGIYKSDTSGDQWQLLTNGFPQKSSKHYSAEIGTVAIDPSNPMLIYAGTADFLNEPATGDGNLFISTDGGNNWSKYNIGSATAAFYKIVVDPNDGNYVFAATSAGFFRSANRGLSWAQIDNLQARGLVAGVDTARSKTILYRTVWSSDIYRSEDLGQSWDKVTTPACPKGCNFYRIALDPSDRSANTIYVGDYGDWIEDQGIFVSTDGGESWSQANQFGDTGWMDGDLVTRVRSLGLDPYHPSELYFGHSMGIYRRSLNGPWNQIFTSPAGSSDPNATVRIDNWAGRGAINNTQVNTKPVFHPTNPNEYMLGYMDLYIWKTTDDGKSWENIKLPGNNDVRSLAADPNDKSFLTWFAGTTAQRCCSGALYKTTDGGQSWKKATGLPNDRIWDIAVTPGNPSTVFAATNGHGLYWSTNGGNAFKAQNGSRTGKLPAESIYHITFDINNPSTIYLAIGGEEGGIFKTVDQGAAWQRTGDFKNCHAVSASPITPQAVYAGCGQDLYESKNGGDSWNLIFKGWEHPLHPGMAWESAYVQDIALHPASPNTLCFVIKDDPYHDQSSGGGLFCTIDGGHVWKNIAEKLGLLLRGISVAFHPLPDPATGGHDLFYMTGGDGAYKIPADDLDR